MTLVNLNGHRRFISFLLFVRECVSRNESSTTCLFAPSKIPKPLRNPRGTGGSAMISSSNEAFANVVACFSHKYISLNVFLQVLLLATINICVWHNETFKIACLASSQINNFSSPSPTFWTRKMPFKLPRSIHPGPSEQLPVNFQLHGAFGKTFSKSRPSECISNMDGQGAKENVQRTGLAICDVLMYICDSDSLLLFLYAWP